jgi:hypothetical protein
MSNAASKDVATVPIDEAKGNALFEKAVAAIGLDDAMMRWLFLSVLNTIGSTPARLTPDELGSLLPEVDRRLRKLVQDAQADHALKRLYRVLFELAEVA